jgi:hypothetical protein
MAMKPVPPRSSSNLLWAAVDLDGTLAEGIWTPDNPTAAIGDPIWDNVTKATLLVNAGYKIVVHTSRPWHDYEAIESWLRYHGFDHLWGNTRIICGKVLAAIYIDDRGRHADAKNWFPPKAAALDEDHAEDPPVIYNPPGTYLDAPLGYADYYARSHPPAV